VYYQKEAVSLLFLAFWELQVLTFFWILGKTFVVLCLNVLIIFTLNVVVMVKFNAFISFGLCNTTAILVYILYL